MQVVDVDFSEAALNRLKTALGKTKDKEVAAALGIGEKAFNARKTRNSFPEKELRALAQRRPELDIDVEYVLTGGRLSPHERQAIDRATQFTSELEGLDAASRERLLTLAHQAGLDTARAAAAQPLSDDERELLEMFRAAPLAAKADAIKVLQGNARKGSMSQAQQTFNAPVSGRVAGRDYREHDPPTKRGAKKR